MIKLPLFKTISAETYNGAFIMGAIFVSFTSCTALALSMLHKKKIDKCKYNHNLYCEINKDNVFLTVLNIYLKTMVITILLSFALFVFFGFGGGHVHNYYKPEISTLKTGLKHVVILLFIYFFFHYIVAFLAKKGNKKLPPLNDVFKSTLYDLDIIKNPPPVPNGWKDANA